MFILITELMLLLLYYSPTTGNFFSAPCGVADICTELGAVSPSVTGSV